MREEVKRGEWLSRWSQDHPKADNDRKGIIRPTLRKAKGRPDSINRAGRGIISPHCSIMKRKEHELSSSMTEMNTVDRDREAWTSGG